MSTASVNSVCLVCGQNLPSPGGNCPSCGASAGWQDLLSAVQFVQERLLDWDRDRVVSRPQFTAMVQANNQLREALKLMAREGKPVPTDIGLPPRDRCWRCNAQLSGSPAHCGECGTPVDGPQARQLRYWTYACRVIKSHYEARRLPLRSAHARMDDAKGANCGSPRGSGEAVSARHGCASSRKAAPAKQGRLRKQWPICSP